MKFILVPLLLALTFKGVFAMSMFNIGKTCVFSEVRARLMINGEPLKHATVVRQWEWNKRRSDTATTDENGYVKFPAVYEASISRLLPTELVVGQQLSVEVAGEEKVVWTNSKREPEENAEYGGAPFNVVCELNNEEVLIEDYGSLMLTLCKLEK